MLTVGQYRAFRRCLRREIDEMKARRRKLFVQQLRATKVQGRLGVEVFQIDPLSEKIARFTRFRDGLSRTNFVPVQSCRTCMAFCSSFQGGKVNHVIQHSLVREDGLVSER